MDCADNAPFTVLHVTARVMMRAMHQPRNPLDRRYRPRCRYIVSRSSSRLGRPLDGLTTSSADTQLHDIGLTSGNGGESGITTFAHVRVDQLIKHSGGRSAER